MTIYTTPDSFEDRTPSAGQRFGTAIGTGLGEGLQMLAQQKIQGLQDRKKAFADHQKGFGELAGSVSKFAKDTGREGYGTEDYDAVRKLAESFYNEGDSRDIATAKAWLEYEKEPETGLDYLKEGRKEGYQTPPTQGRFMDLFKPKETEGSTALYERASDKAKTAKSLDEFSMGELVSLKPSDIENLPKEEQEKFWKAAPFLAKRMEGIASSAAIPFVGGALEERFREQIDPDLAPPPGIATASRIAGELPFLGALLGGATKGAQAVRGAATFGGDAALNEFIRTVGTEKPADLKVVGIQAGLGALFPYAEAGIKALAKPFRNAIAKRMQRGAKSGLEATESIFKDANKAGISIEELQKGADAEKVKFTEFLEKDGNKTMEKTKEVVKPEISKGRKKETLKGRAEAPKEAEKRFAKEAQTISKTPIEKYLEPRKVTKGVVERKARLGPRLQNTEKRIGELEKDLLKTTGKELKTTQESLSSLKDKKYALEHEIKYGKPPPTAAELTAQAEKSTSNIVDMIMNPTDGTLKAIQKNDKMMNTFLERAKDEVVKGKLPQKYAEGTFLGVQDAHLKAYKDLQKDIKQQMVIPFSNVRASGQGQTILDEVGKRIKGLEAAQKVQQQKRKVQSALKGPTGKFYRNWVDKLKGEQDLFSKDMIRIGDKISKAEKNLTPVAKERIEKAAASSVKGGEKEIIKGAEQAGFGKTESVKIGKALEDLKNPPKFKTFEEARKWMISKANTLLLPVKNQIMAGFILGSIDPIIKETTGKKLPSKVKLPIYGIAGLYGKTGSRRPFLALTSWATNAIWDSTRKSFHKEKLHSKKGIERRREYEKIKKKGFTAKELKEIRS